MVIMASSVAVLVSFMAVLPLVAILAPFKEEAAPSSSKVVRT